MTLMERIESKIERVTESGCWIWTASCDTKGYGGICVDGEMRKVHRVVYEITTGAIPDGLQLDHLCRVRSCVNPYHLEPVECRENIRRGEGPTAKRMAQTHCIHGHELTGCNVYYAPSRKQCRICRTCKNEQKRKLNAKKREAMK